jgi:Tfp pilus assembly protein PilF
VTDDLRLSSLYQQGMTALADITTVSAEEHAREVLKRYPNNIPVRMDLVYDYLDKKDYGKAKSMLLEIIGIDNHNFLAYNALGCLSYEQKEYTGAIDFFTHALECCEAGQEDDLLWNMTSCEYRLADYSRAKEYFLRISDKIKYSNQESKKEIIRAILDK